jgi:uncharacterized protein YuzE
MQIQYDKDVDAAYIYLEYPIKPGEVKKTVKVKDDINMDFDDNGRLLGVEILNASKHLNKKLILEAQQI